jgi:hypothetical protein
MRTKSLCRIFSAILVYLVFWFATAAYGPDLLYRQLKAEAEGKADTATALRKSEYGLVRSRANLQLDVRRYSCKMPFVFRSKITILSDQGTFGLFFWTPWKIYTLSEFAWIV